LDRLKLRELVLGYWFSSIRLPFIGSICTPEHPGRQALNSRASAAIRGQTFRSCSARLKNISSLADVSGIDGQNHVPMRARKTLEKILSGSKNIRFEDMTGLARAFGFRQVRVSGSHHIFSHPAVKELVNLQEVHGQAKPYQIRQFIKLVEQYNLELAE
jgi:predicted RNA binding protein YcfA (HicA-like mRNA interferase family)